MTDSDHKKIIEDLMLVIAEAIRTNVNGKVDKLTKEVTEALEIAKAAAETSYHNSKQSVALHKELNTKFDQYVKDDTEWKKDNEPYLKALANVTGAAKLLVWIAGGVGTISVAWLVFKEWLKTLIK